MLGARPRPGRAHRCPIRRRSPGGTSRSGAGSTTGRSTWRWPTTRWPSSRPGHPPPPPGGGSPPARASTPPATRWRPSSWRGWSTSEISRYGDRRAWFTLRLTSAGSLGRRLVVLSRPARPARRSCSEDMKQHVGSSVFSASKSAGVHLRRFDPAPATQRKWPLTSGNVGGVSPAYQQGYLRCRLSSTLLTDRASR